MTLHFKIPISRKNVSLNSYPFIWTSFLNKCSSICRKLCLNPFLIRNVFKSKLVGANFFFFCELKIDFLEQLVTKFVVRLLVIPSISSNKNMYFSETHKQNIQGLS